MESGLRPPTEESSGDFRSALESRRGHGRKHEKRASVAETAERIRKILSILPHKARQEVSRDFDRLREDPEAAVEAIRNKILIYEDMMELLDNPNTSTDEALRMLDELIPEKPEKAQ